MDYTLDSASLAAGAALIATGSTFLASHLSRRHDASMRAADRDFQWRRDTWLLDRLAVAEFARIASKMSTSIEVLRFQEDIDMSTCEPSIRAYAEASDELVYRLTLLPIPVQRLSAELQRAATTIAARMSTGDRPDEADRVRFGVTLGEFIVAATSWLRANEPVQRTPSP